MSTYLGPLGILDTATRAGNRQNCHRPLSKIYVFVLSSSHYRRCIEPLMLPTA